MDVSLYQAAAAMNAGSRWQEVISDNLAANQVTGFKKQDLSFSAVQAGFMGTAARGVGSKRSEMPLASTTTNFQAGELCPTGVATDLAVDGTGFFEVQMPDGTNGYTRDGGFRVSTKGQLTTKQGLAVMGQTGPLKLDPYNPAPITVNPAGEVSQGGEPKGRLKLTEFDNPAGLVLTGNGLFVDTELAAQPHDASESTVQQGFLENANTSTMTEMGNLISAMRFYEANQKVIQTEDDRVGRLISDVANPA
jgi:flagellar basal body rod protein FlgG